MRRVAERQCRRRGVVGDLGCNKNADAKVNATFALKDGEEVLAGHSETNAGLLSDFRVTLNAQGQVNVAGGGHTRAEYSTQATLDGAGIRVITGNETYDLTVRTQEGVRVLQVNGHCTSADAPK